MGVLPALDQHLLDSKFLYMKRGCCTYLVEDRRSPPNFINVPPILAVIQKLNPKWNMAKVWSKALQKQLMFKEWKVLAPLHSFMVVLKKQCEAKE